MYRNIKIKYICEFLNNNFPENVIPIKKLNKKQKKGFYSKNQPFFSFKSKLKKSNDLLKKRLFNKKNSLEKKVLKQAKIFFSPEQIKAETLKKQPRFSEYKNQIKERKKLSVFYGNLSKKYIQKLLDKNGLSAKIKKHTKSNWLALLESRLDIVLVRICFSSNIKKARQWITHKKILVNGNINTFSGYHLKPGDVISLNSTKPKKPKVIYNKKSYKTRRFSDRQFVMDLHKVNSWAYQNKNTDKFNFLILDFIKTKLKKKNINIFSLNEKKNTSFFSFFKEKYKKNFFLLQEPKKAEKKEITFLPFHSANVPCLVNTLCPKEDNLLCPKEDNLLCPKEDNLRLKKIDFLRTKKIDMENIEDKKQKFFFIKLLENFIKKTLSSSLFKYWVISNYFSFIQRKTKKERLKKKFNFFYSPGLENSIEIKKNGIPFCFLFPKGKKKTSLNENFEKSLLLKKLNYFKIQLNIFSILEKNIQRLLKNPSFSKKKKNFFLDYLNTIKKNISCDLFFLLKIKNFIKKKPSLQRLVLNRRLSSAKPVHLEVSHKKFLAIFLYYPQKINLPITLDLELIWKSIK